MSGQQGRPDGTADVIVHDYSLASRPEIWSIETRKNTCDISFEIGGRSGFSAPGSHQSLYLLNIDQA